MQKISQKNSRPPLARMMQIHDQLQQRRFPNCSTLSQDLEVSYKTIQRDIDFMRDQLNLPISYNTQKRGFFYTESVSSFPTMSVTQGELVSLLIAQKALEQYRGTAFEKPIASAFNKLATALDASQNVSIQELSEAFSFKPSSLPTNDLQLFSQLAEAVTERRMIAIDYEPLTGKRSTNRHLEPYHLGCISDQWYLIGRDPAKNAIRTFALSRISKACKTTQPFERPRDFNLNKMLEGSFSAFESRQTKTIRILLEPFAARIATERKWHPSQKLKPLSNGKTELTLSVDIAPDLENWILSWGPLATVLEPQDLRHRIANLIQQANSNYQSI